jgi:hypothetical protein
MIDFVTGTVTTDDGLTFGRGIALTTFLERMGERAVLQNDQYDYRAYHVDVIVGETLLTARVHFHQEWCRLVRLKARDTGIVGEGDHTQKAAQAAIDVLHRAFLKRQFGGSLPKSKSFNWGRVERLFDLLGAGIELRFSATLRG